MNKSNHLSKQVHIFSLDTSSFYNNAEYQIHLQLRELYLKRSQIEKAIKKASKSGDVSNLKEEKKAMDKQIKCLNANLVDLFPLHDGIRNLRQDAMIEKNIISVFETTLTRTLGIVPDTLTTDFIIVKTYFQDVLKDIIVNGFMHDGEKYVYFTAGAGQIRNKKIVFIKQSLWLQHSNTLTCGLSVEDINRQGGMNENKYLAYLALSNSATDVWADADIDKMIVVNDMDFPINTLVDFIDDKTYVISRQQMDVMINHTDGCGMILPSKSKKSFMVRLPWIKGLLVPFPFDKFARQNNSFVVKDIYGKEWDIVKDGIEVIFTKSQFKMWKFYRDWDEYKSKFKQYVCQAAKASEEEDIIPNAKLNYQMLQTLNEMTKNELSVIAQKTICDIESIASNRDTMLKVLGVTPTNTNKNYFQQALEIYPELLADTFSRETLKEVKKSMVKNAKHGKLEIDGKYTYIIPDLYAFCEHLFLGVEQPNGLLQNGEVYFSLYKQHDKLDCLRSPHLYREHAVRRNVCDKDKAKWFITKGLYTSCHDPISKLLMFDCDGDKSLVTADKTIISVAERHMKDIVPLYYNMASAKANIINGETIFNGLKTAYNGGNIGTISNEITKIWNSNDVDIDMIKWLCMENNFVIDFAKTLYKPKRPKRVKNQAQKYSNTKLPYFFIYAKKKDEDQVEPINYSVVNMLDEIIPKTKMNFTASNLGKFNYKMLMHNKKLADGADQQAIIDKYTQLDQRKHFIMQTSNDDEIEPSDELYIYRSIRKQLLEINPDINYVVDVLVKYLYQEKNSDYKTTLWSSFGDVIVKNLNSNIKQALSDGYIQCESCGGRTKIKKQRQELCESCESDKKRENARIRKQRQRGKVS